MRVEDLFAKAAIEALDEGILIRLARLDVPDRDAVGRAQLHESLGCELGPVVDAHAGRAAVQPYEIVEDPNHARTRIDVPISIASASRLPSSITLKVRKRRPS